MGNNRFQYLDALRGLAALIVVFHHAEIASWGSPMVGKTCVYIFFLLSGFVLTYKYLGVPHQSTRIIMAIVKRPFRLFGITAAAVIIGSVCNYQLLVDVYRHILKFGAENPFALAVIVIGPLWTMETEICGSFLVFMVCLIVQRQLFSRRLIVDLLIFIVFYKLGSFAMMAFILGMACADVYKHLNNHLSTELIAIASLTCGLAVYSENTALMTWLQDSGIIFLLPNLHFVAAVGIFVGIVFLPVLHPTLSWRPLLWLGRISFSLYAIHWIFVVILHPRILAACHQQLTYAWSVEITASIAAAWMLTKYVDEPCIKLSGVIADRIVNPGPVTPKQSVAVKSTPVSIGDHALQSSK